MKLYPHEGRYCIDIMIESLFRDHTASWIRIVNGINKCVTETSEEIQSENIDSTFSTGKAVAKSEPKPRSVVNSNVNAPIPERKMDRHLSTTVRSFAELQRHLAPVEYPPPEGHSLVINAETPDSACGSALWQKIRDRWRARRAERETKARQTAAWRDEGRRDDGELGAEGNRQGRQQEHGREAAQRRPQDALRPV